MAVIGNTVNKINKLFESRNISFVTGSIWFMFIYFCHYKLKKKYIIIYNVYRIKGKKWREGP